MKTFTLTASFICIILFMVCLAGFGDFKHLIAFGIFSVLFYLEHLNCKINELKDE